MYKLSPVKKCQIHKPVRNMFVKNEHSAYLSLNRVTHYHLLNSYSIVQGQWGIHEHTS